GVAERAATRETTQLATALAIEAQGEPGWGRGDAFARSVDAVLGALRRAGVDSRMLRSAKTRRAGLLAELLERTDAMFRARRIFDDRALAWVAAHALDQGVADEVPSSVVIDGFSYFDPSQSACLEALARRTRVVVRMPQGADTVLSDLE